jgi:hypothetical protein
MRPAFPLLAASPIKDKYFIRTCQWRWLDEKSIYITDKNQPRVITLDTWPQVVYLEATGDKTIAEFIEQMASLYTSTIPPELDEVILGEINTLVKEKVVELRDAPEILPTEILVPLP